MTVRLVLLACLWALLALTGPAAKADNFHPAYLQLNERPGDVYDIRWKAPAQSEVAVLPVKPVFPTGSRMSRPLQSSYAAGAVVMRGQVEVPGGLEGRSIGFAGLGSTGNQVLVRLVRLDGSEDLFRVSPQDPRVQLPRQPGAIGVSARYTVLGVEHILFGFDHLLFVAALFLLVGDLRTLFWTITSFTVAHSITLALVTLDAISVPVPPVEAFIALSIVFVAVEVVRKLEGKPSLAARKPWLVAFAFGLVHGLGFASALAQIGLPQNNVPLALLFFNVGVELGQVGFIVALLAVSAVVRRLASPQHLHAARLASCYAIGGIASYWMIERVSAFA